MFATTMLVFLQWDREDAAALEPCREGSKEGCNARLESGTDILSAKLQRRENTSRGGPGEQHSFESQAVRDLAIRRILTTVPIAVLVVERIPLGCPRSR